MVLQNELGTFIVLKQDKVTDFHCDECDKEKKSKSIIRHINKEGNARIICNACYGYLMSTIKP